MRQTDDDLKVVFANLRAEDTRLAPTFRQVLTADRARDPRPFWRSPKLRWAAVVVAGAMIAVGMVVQRSTVERRLPMNQDRIGYDMPVVWRAPTDFLLSVPGHEVVSGVPGLGATVPPETFRIDW